MSSFNYVGVVLSSGGSFIMATNTLAGKALRAMNYKIYESANIMFNLFDTFVLSLFLTMHVKYGGFQILKI